MKKQLVKGMTMAMLVVALAFVSAVASAYGQSNYAARADVPFEFVVGGRTLPAGHYELSVVNSGGEVVRIRNNDTEQSTLSLTMALTKGAKVEQGKLVFRRYGHRYFLAEIWKAGERNGRRLMKSKEEKAIEGELASIKSNPENGYERIEVALVRQ